MAYLLIRKDNGVALLATTDGTKSDFDSTLFELIDAGDINSAVDGDGNRIKWDKIQAKSSVATPTEIDAALALPQVKEIQDVIDACNQIEAALVDAQTITGMKALATKLKIIFDKPRKIQLE